MIERIPRHIRFRRSVSSRDFFHPVGKTLEVGSEISVTWALKFLLEGTAEPEGSAIYVPEVVHAGGGMFELPDGSRVKGREAAEAELEAWVARGFRPAPEEEESEVEEGEAEE